MARIKITEEDKVKFYKIIHPIAIRERKKLFEDKDLNNEINLLEQLGFIIVKFPSKDESLSGFCIEKSGKKCIYINTNTTKGRQHFTLWHEYYHLITGDGIGVSYRDEEKYNESECRAHLFASVFLMPEELVSKFISKNNITFPYIKNCQIMQMANEFKVSFSAALYRINQLYPGHGLGSRYGTGSNHGKLKDISDQNNLSIEYEENTNDCYITEMFFEQIQKNYNEGKINNDKLEFIKELLEKAKENCRVKLF